MLTKVMHQTMIDQAKVFANTVQNSLIKALNKGAKGGYLGLAYFQPKRTPPVFQQDQSTALPIDDSTVRIAPSPQVVTGSSSDSQPIQNQGIGEKAKYLAVTMPMIKHMKYSPMPKIKHF
jgi:hypothetical protein